MAHAFGKGAGSYLAQSSDKADKDEKARACSAKVTPGKSRNLGDAKALLAVIRRVAEQQGCAKAKPGSTLRLRITVDAAGKIAKVERLAGDATVATAMISKLTGESSTTVARTASEGTLELTIVF